MKGGHSVSVKEALFSVLFFLVGLVFLALCVPILGWISRNVGSASPQKLTETKGAADVMPSYDSMLPSYDMFVNNLSSVALEGLMEVEKVYFLPEDSVVGPKPNPDRFGRSTNPADTAAVLEDAKERLDLEETVWSPDRPVVPGSEVHWYLDDTIFSVTWKEPHSYACFTISEIKIAHPSQFKRFFAENTFSAAIQYRPSDMAYSVNAVTALSGDFYKNRTFGAVVYQRQLYRFEPPYLDMCLVDGEGNMNFIHAGEISSQEEMLQYLDANNILFSLCFGPIMIENGEVVVPDSYLIGEINDIYARCCVCQLGPCHYLLVTSNSDGNYGNYLNVRDFATEVRSLGVEKAYTLDGGQTAAMYTDGQLINAVEFGHERNISDIIYFVTALPEEGAG